jgi:hypothetical protein
MLMLSLLLGHLTGWALVIGLVVIVAIALLPKPPPA